MGDGTDLGMGRLTIQRKEQRGQKGQLRRNCAVRLTGMPDAQMVPYGDPRHAARRNMSSGNTVCVVRTNCNSPWAPMLHTHFTSFTAPTASTGCPPANSCPDLKPSIPRPDDGNGFLTVHGALWGHPPTAFAAFAARPSNANPQGRPAPAPVPPSALTPHSLPVDLM